MRTATAGHLREAGVVEARVGLERPRTKRVRSIEPRQQQP
jgi:hypothetical protein